VCDENWIGLINQNDCMAAHDRFFGRGLDSIHKSKT
jgi:hypothetical protein